MAAGKGGTDTPGLLGVWGLVEPPNDAGRRGSEGVRLASRPREAHANAFCSAQPAPRETEERREEEEEKCVADPSPPNTMLHWLEVSRPTLLKLKNKESGTKLDSNKFPNIKANSKARREWNSRLPVEGMNKGLGSLSKQNGNGESQRSTPKYPTKPHKSDKKKDLEKEKKGKVDTDLDATVKFLELHIAALQSKHNALRRICREKKHIVSKCNDKCNNLRRENKNAQNLLHHKNTLKEIQSACHEKNYNLEDFEREFSHSDYLRPVVSLSSVSSLATFEDDNYVHQLEDTLKRVNIGKMKEQGIEMSLVHMMRRNQQANSTSSANAEKKRSDLVLTCKRLEKHQHKVLKARHLKKVAFENKANFEQYVNTNRSIWMKKINHRRTHVNKLRQARERLKKKMGSQKGGGKDILGNVANSVVDSFEFNVIRNRFEKLQNAIGTTDLTFLADTICETIQGTTNLNGKVLYLQEKLEQKNFALKEVKNQLNSLQIHGSTDFTGTYKKVENLEDELQNKLHLLKGAASKERATQQLISACSNYFSELTKQLQPLKLISEHTSIQSKDKDAGETVGDGGEVESVPEVIKTLQLCETKIDLLCRLEKHDFNMSEVLKDQEREEMGAGHRRNSVVVSQMGEKGQWHEKRLSTTSHAQNSHY